MSDDGGMWVTSEPAADGSYQVTLHLSDDVSVALDEAAAVAYALAVLDAAEAAEHDAAVLRQLTSIRPAAVSEEQAVRQAGPVIDVLRERRRVRATGTPLTLVPGVSRDATPGPGEPAWRGFLVVKVNGQAVGQLDVLPAQQHALYVMLAVSAVADDRLYQQVLTDVVGVKDYIAAKLVAELGQFRQAGWEDVPGG